MIGIINPFVATAADPPLANVSFPASGFGSATTLGTTMTTGAIPSGVADAGRRLFAIVSTRVGIGTAIQPTSLTIGGVAAAKIQTAAAANVEGVNGLHAISVWSAVVPTGTTAVVVGTYATGVNNMGVTLYRVVGLNSLVAHAFTATAFNASTTCSLNVNMQANSFALAGITGYATSTAWTGVTESHDTLITGVGATVAASSSGFITDPSILGTYTFSSYNIGVAHPQRLVAVAVYARRVSANPGVTPASVSIGGSAATKVADIVENSGTSGRSLSIWARMVPTGTTAAIVVTAPSGSYDTMSIHGWVVQNAQSATVAAAQVGVLNHGAVSTFNLALTRLAGGASVGSVFWGLVTAEICNWTNLTTQFNSQVIKSGISTQVCGGGQVSNEAAGAQNKTGTYTANTPDGLGAAACFTGTPQSRMFSAGLVTTVTPITPRTITSTHGSGTGIGISVSMQ